MEQVNPQNPQTQKPVTQELPHLVVDEPKRSKVGIFGIVILSLLLLGLPVGIFLVSQRTQLAPQAAVTEVVPEAGAGILLESKLSLDSQNGIIPVDVYVKSPIDAMNLVNAQISFNPALIEVDKVATDAAVLNIQPVFNKWVEAGFDNSKGTISIISGLPAPGAKTGSPNDEKIYLATLFLKPQAEGSTVLEVSPESQILRNSDNENVFKSGNDLALNLTRAIIEPSPSTVASKAEEDVPLIVITSPQTAANYSYFNSINIAWSSFNVETVAAINLYMNGQLLGPITQNIEASVGTFAWQPRDTLALHHIQPANNFQIEIAGISEDGKTVKVLSGPFGILGTEQVLSSPPDPETFSQNQLSIADVSRVLTNYLVQPLKDASLDLNRDGVINELDLFLIRQNLLIRGVIK